MNSAHLDTIRAAWNAYQADYMQFHLKEWPDFHKHFAKGDIMLEEYVVDALGDVTGLALLDICCACDAKQAFSWVNLGAHVTACDLSPEAIRIARDNAKAIGSQIDFRVDDAQRLDTIPNSSFDIVFATYLRWFEDLPLACRNWYRVLRPEGRLLMHFGHPVTWNLSAQDGGLVPGRDYFDAEPVRDDFTGTDIAERHGGWSRSMPCVEFHHTLSGVIDAALSAGYHLLAMAEHRHSADPLLSKLPSHVVLVWCKPQGSHDFTESSLKCPVKEGRP